MNNEEKILKLLDEVIIEQKSMREEQKSMREEQKSMREEQKSMREEQKSMRDDLARVAVTQENVVLPTLKLLAEGQDDLRSRLDQLSEQVRALSVIDRMQDDIIVLKSSVRFLTQELEQLKNATA